MKEELNKLSKMAEVAQKVCAIEGHQIVIFTLEDKERIVSSKYKQLAMCTACGATLDEIRGE